MVPQPTRRQEGGGKNRAAPSSASVSSYRTRPRIRICRFNYFGILPSQGRPMSASGPRALPSRGRWAQSRRNESAPGCGTETLVARERERVVFQHRLDGSPRGIVADAVMGEEVAAFARDQVHVLQDLEPLVVVGIGDAHARAHHLQKID